MRKTGFLVIATILMLGLVGVMCPLPTATGYITIAVVGPMTDIQGINMWNSAQLEATSINNSGGILITGSPQNTRYYIKLLPVETNETTTGLDGIEGNTSLSSVINNVDFCVGGFRTSAVAIYRDVAMNHSKIFMDCGADCGVASGSLQFSVVTNYSIYKYCSKLAHTMRALQSEAFSI